jgi:hypothetical protein
MLRNVRADQFLTVSIADAQEDDTRPQPVIAENALFREITSAAGIHYTHKDVDQIDFTIQSLLPHKFSEYCPALAVGDLDANGLDDLVIGGNQNNPATLLLQQPDGKFRQKDLDTKFAGNGSKDEGILVFDANGDGKPDIYIARGGYKAASDSSGYQDVLYINDGSGNFMPDSAALPANHGSKLCVRGFDYNNDGKMDLFVSGRVQPAKYPKPVSSFIFRNDSRDGHVRFTDVTDEVAPGLRNIGLVCDALFTDFNGDGQTDLIVVGEWMPVTFFKNVTGKFVLATEASGVSNRRGWWNSIAAGDFRHTGRMDYIVGNVGLNSLYQASEQYPVSVTAKEFDNNGAYIAIPSLYLPDTRGEKKEFPAMGRDDIARQMPVIKKKFPNYKPFALATMDEILTPDERKSAIRLQANTMQSAYLRNDGGGKFTMLPLPIEAQVSVINGIIVDDFDGDGNLDVLLNGNDFGTEVGIGRYDALNGLLLKGDGAGNFAPLTMSQSGIDIPGNGKALVKLRGSSGRYLVAASQNRGPLKLYESNKRSMQIPVDRDEIRAILHFKDGGLQQTELYNGSSFLSQSGRFLTVGKKVSSVEIFNRSGTSRKIFCGP